MNDDGPVGVQKVAAFLLSLDKEAAVEVLSHLDDEVVSQVAVAMSELDESFVDHAAVERLYREIALQLHTPEGVRRPDASQLQRLLEDSIGAERAGEVLEEIRERRRHERPFAQIESRPPETVAAALRGESVAAIAPVRAHVDPGLSAEVLGALEPERALAVVTHMATLVPPGIETLNTIATDLERRIEEVGRRPIAADPRRQLKTVAEMLNFTKREIERSVMEGLEDSESEIAAGIREHMFTWADLADVDRRSMQKILASVDTRTLAVALKACSAEVEQSLLGNLSKRVQAMVEEERDIAGAVPMSEVLAARAELLNGVHALIDAGEFQPARAGEDLVS